MNFFDWIILITLNTSVYTKYVDISDESIEKVLYYKDCRLDKHTEKPTPRAITVTPKPPIKLKHQNNVMQSCPQMCCSICCPSNLNNQQMNENSYMTNTMIQPNFKSRQESPSIQPRFRRKEENVNKDNIDVKKDNIRKLISHDDDIKKILKELVKVAMQKLDVVQLVDAQTADPKHSYSFEEEYE